MDVGERISSVKQPVLLITGGRDRLVPPADTERVAAALTSAELKVIPECGHLPHEECPGPFLETVGPWLDRLGP